MRIILLAGLAFCCTTGVAEVYRCPDVYPGKDGKRPNLPLTSAFMHQGEMHGDGWITGRNEVAEEGIDTRYGFMDDEQAWLVCTYGGKKRVKGRVHDGHEWGQYMDGREREWWLKLAPKVGVCDLQVREVKSHVPGDTAWTAVVSCTQP